MSRFFYLMKFHGTPELPTLPDFAEDLQILPDSGGENKQSFTHKFDNLPDLAQTFTHYITCNFENLPDL